MQSQDPKKWPKHAIVSYQWRNVARVDLEAGVGVAVLLGLVAAGAAGWRSFAGYLDDFQELLDVAAGGGQARVQGAAGPSGQMDAGSFAQGLGGGVSVMGAVQAVGAALSPVAGTFAPMQAQGMKGD